MTLISSKNMPLDYKSNGCGSDTARFDFVPDTIYGMSIFEACRRHDWAYKVGGTKYDKFIGDMEFLYNMIVLIINIEDTPHPTFLGLLRAMKYFYAVHTKGDSSFNFHSGEPDGIS